MSEVNALDVECPECGMPPLHFCCANSGLGRSLSRSHAGRMHHALICAVFNVQRDRDDAVRLLAMVVRGGNPSGPDWQRINELTRTVDR